jgi:competence ComEA-like helix-hairpin-helix protein
LLAPAWKRFEPTAPALRLLGVFTPAERNALLFLSTLIALGSGARVMKARQPPPSPADSAAFALHVAQVDAARGGRGGKKGVGRKTKAAKKSAAELLAAGPPIDLDTASASEIQRLPGIGPVVAARIAANRDTFGAFGSLDGLRRVKGVGPALTKSIRPYVTFSGVARPATAVLSPGRAPRERQRAPRATRVPDG